MNNSIKSLKKTIIIITTILLAIAILYLYVYTSPHMYIGGGPVEHQALVNQLNIISYCITIFSIIVLDITIIFAKKDNKKFYYKLVGIFSIFILIIPIIIALIGDYIYNDDIKNNRYTSWWSETEQIHPYNP